MSQYSIAKYVGGEVVLGDGGSQNAPGIPAGTTAIWCAARGGAVYLTLNGGASPNTSPMYVPEDGLRLYGPFDNIHSLGIYADAGVYAHLTYEKDRLP